MTSAFDRALETTKFMVEREVHARSKGEPGSLAYLTAWCDFQRRPPEPLDPPAKRPTHPPPTDAQYERILTVAIERAMLIDGAQMATAQVLDRPSRSLRIVAHTGFSQDFLECFNRVGDDAPAACGSALAARAPVWVSRTADSPIFAGSVALDVLMDAGSRAVASLPAMSSNGDVVAMLSTHHAGPMCWTPQQRHRLMLLAAAVGRLLG